jgi:hypothetical protein
MKMHMWYTLGGTFAIVLQQIKPIARQLFQKMGRNFFGAENKFGAHFVG